MTGISGRAGGGSKPEKKDDVYGRGGIRAGEVRGGFLEEGADAGAEDK